MVLGLLPGSRRSVRTTLKTSPSVRDGTMRLLLSAVAAISLDCDLTHADSCRIIIDYGDTVSALAGARNLDSQHHRGVPSCAIAVSREAVSRVSEWMKSFRPAIRMIVILVGNAISKPGVPIRTAGPSTIQTSRSHLL